MKKAFAVVTVFALVAGYVACGNAGNPGTADSGVPSYVPTFSNGSSGANTSGGSSTGSSVGTSTGASSGGSSGTVMASSSSACTTSTGPITGTVGNTGGSISRLVFAVAGDTRPANEDDTAGYPTTIIDTIFSDIEAQSPHPPLVIGTGDYQFSEAGSNGTGAAQVQIYMQSRQKYSGAFFPAMGNHECGVSGSFTTSDNNDCGPGNPGGVTTNYNAFMNDMMAPISQTTPYYSINVNAMDNTWTAKFVVTAANAWDSAQQSWLQTVMAKPTTYTFVVRHEASDATPPLPNGVAGVDAVLATSTYTMIIVGHNHSHGHYNDASGTHQEVIFGNGGAPITDGSDFGYGLFSQRCDGAIVVDAIDYMTGATDSYFHFVVTPNGVLTN